MNLHLLNGNLRFMRVMSSLRRVEDRSGEQGAHLSNDRASIISLTVIWDFILQ